jgi:hypothetical protein
VARWNHDYQKVLPFVKTPAIAPPQGSLQKKTKPTKTFPDFEIFLFFVAVCKHSSAIHDELTSDFGRLSKRTDGPAGPSHQLDKCLPSGFTRRGSEYIFSS